MRTEKYFQSLKEEMRQYGNISINDLLKVITQEEEIINAIGITRIQWISCYGSGAYELAGERHNERGTINELLCAIFKVKVSILSLSDLDDEYIEDAFIPKELENKLFESFYEDECVGNSWKLKYDIEFIDGKPDKDTFTKYISRITTEDGFRYEDLDKYFDF